jgi:hypothetical protein
MQIGGMEDLQSPLPPEARGTARGWLHYLPEGLTGAFFGAGLVVLVRGAAPCPDARLFLIVWNLLRFSFT